MARSAPRDPSWLRDLLAFLAATVLLAGLVYLAAGLWAAVAQDGVSAEMRAGLSSELPLPVRVFRNFVTWLWRVSPLVFAIPIVLFGLRLALRRSGRVGESWTFDLLVAPLAGAVAAAVVMGVFVATHPAPGDDPFVAAGWTTVVTAVVLILLGLVAALLARFRAVRLGVLLVAALVLVARAGADVWGSWRLRQYDETWEKELAIDRGRAAAEERPALRGESRPDNAAPRYQAIFDSVGAQVAALGYQGREPVERAARAAPDQPLTEKVRDAVSPYRDAVSSLRDATRSQHCDWQLPFGELYWKGRTIWAPRFLGDSLVVLGHERTQAKDPAGAAWAYLDAVRFGADYGEGDLLMAIWGTSFESLGLEALGRLIAGGDPSLVPLAEIDRELGLLEGHLTSMSGAYRRERLGLGHFRRRVDESPGDAGLQDPKILPWIVPYRALAALALRSYRPYQHEIETALLEDDPASTVAVSHRIEATFGSSWNPVARGVTGQGGFPLGALEVRSLRLSEDNSKALLRLARFAVRLEQSRTKAGLYPAGTQGLDPPVDPLAWPKLVRYEVRSGGRGYRIWSVGRDGKDDGGDPETRKDVVLERKPR